MDTAAIICTVLNGRFRGILERDAVLADLTTFRIGGKADLLAIPRGMEDLRHLAHAVTDSGADFLVLGRGSNVLISDLGYRGVVVVLGKGLRRIKHKAKDIVYVDAGCDLNDLISFSIKRGMGGIEDLSGIPGTVGGAVRMNAGAMGSAIGDRVEEVSILRMDSGEVEDTGIAAEDIGFGYRRAGIGDEEIIYKVKLKLYRDAKDGLKSRRMEVLRWRNENQPLRQASAGSVFRNPEGASAGELIDRCGLKGLRVGDAMVSTVHANFIVNMGRATAGDVYRLITRIKKEIRLEEGIELREEIRIVGEMEEEE